jgi:uncharacterized protein YbjT (DUF2867 family)
MNVVVAGATGLVGKEIIRQLDERKDAPFTALVRKTGRLRSVSGRVQEVVFDYEDPASYERLGTEIACDVLLCALGTTIKVAGSPEAFRKVDLDYPAKLVKQLATLERKPLVGLVSSVGAGKPRGLYLSTKAELEKCLRESGLPYVILRPSLLMGRRKEFRLGERIAQILMKPYLFFAKLLTPQSKLLWKYAPIEASAVAHALLLTCLDGAPGGEPSAGSARILEGLSLHHPIFAIGGE